MADDNVENREAGERISKVVSRAGVASRRDVERMIEEGRIALNGETVTTPVTLVKPRDRIFVDGVALPAKERTRLFLYHKPVGLVTTEKDPEGRPTVFSALPPDLPRLVSVGRLDLNTEGLLLLTNDGGLARVLAHPTTGWLRRYRVRAFGEITQDQLDQLKNGIEIEGMHYGPVEAHVDREQGSNIWLTLGLREGKNREVKRILEHFGLMVNRLIRISFGPFQLGDLAEGAVEEVRTRMLKDQLGKDLAREAGVEFDDEVQEAPRPERPPRRERPLGEPRGRPTPRGSLERQPKEPSPRSAQPKDAQQSSSSLSDEARALRKAEAIAQGQRSAAHRHSWRDAESWAQRGERKGGSAGERRNGTANRCSEIRCDRNAQMIASIFAAAGSPTARGAASSSSGSFRTRPPRRPRAGRVLFVPTGNRSRGRPARTAMSCAARRCASKGPHRGPAATGASGDLVRSDLSEAPGRVLPANWRRGRADPGKRGRKAGRPMRERPIAAAPRATLNVRRAGIVPRAMPGLSARAGATIRDRAERERRRARRVASMPASATIDRHEATPRANRWAAKAAGARRSARVPIGHLAVTAMIVNRARRVRSVLLASGSPALREMERPARNVGSASALRGLAVSSSSGARIETGMAARKGGEVSFLGATGQSATDLMASSRVARGRAGRRPEGSGSARTDLASSELASSELARSELARTDLARTDLTSSDLARTDLARIGLARIGLAGHPPAGRRASLGPSFTRSKDFGRCHIQLLHPATARS